MSEKTSLSLFDELQIVYDLTNRLNNVGTRSEWLEAISSYARKRGASRGYLVTIAAGHAENMPHIQIEAAWQDAHPHETSEKLALFPQFWPELSRVATANMAFMLPDTAASPQLSESLHQAYRAIGVKAAVILPHTIDEDGLYLIAFHWPQPTEFDEVDQRIFNTGIQLSAAVIDNLKLTEQEHNRSISTERINKINIALSQAQDEQEILRALTQFSHPRDQVRARLMDLQLDERNRSYAISRMAEMGVARSPYDTQRLLTRQEIDLIESRLPIFVQAPQKSGVFVTDQDIHALLVMPLRNAGKWQALIFVEWLEPHVFTEEEEIIFRAVHPILSAVVARHFAYLEKLSSERATATLYRLAEDITAASSYQEVTDCVARLLPDCDGVFLNVWQHMDYERATSLDTLAVSAMPDDVRRRISASIPKIPVFEKLLHEKIWVCEDIDTDHRLDPESYAVMSSLPTKALLAVPLRTGQRFWGLIVFNYALPRSFSPHERRLALGISDMMQAAFSRLQSQQETEQARETATVLYQLAESVNAATTYQQTLEAVATLMPDCQGVYLNLWQHHDYASAEYLEVVAAASIKEDLAQSIGQRFAKADFPFASETHTERLVVVEDVQTDPRIDTTSRISYAQLGTKAYMRVTFQSEGRHVGAVFFKYTSTRHFAETERQLALGIADLVVAAVERIRLLQETADAVEAQRQTLQIEQETREELSLLYRASEALNAATNYQEIVQAIAPLTRHQICHLILWENLDYETSTSFKFVGGIRDFSEISPFVGSTRPDSDFPVSSITSQLRQFVSEDIPNDERIDPVSRNNWEAANVRAIMLTNLQREGRFLGVLTFENERPHKFSERDRRLTLAISDLVLSAVIRIHTQMELDTAVKAQHEALLAETEARREIALLYQVSKQINQATSMDEVLHAARQVFVEPVDVAIFAWENYDRDGASYLETIVSTDPSLATGTRIPREIVSGSASLGPNEVLIIDDVDNSRWSEDSTADSARYMGISTIASKNLLHGSRIQGAFAITSYQPYIFSPQEIRLMSAIADLSAAALERFRSRQAEEEARQEREQLFLASQAINAANSFQEILKAVSHINSDSGDYYLYIFENYDFRNATYIETVATGEDRFMNEGMRISLELLPYLKEHPRPGLFAYEDIENNPLLDDTTRQTMLSHGVMSNLRVGLIWHRRILGAFGIDHAFPKRYSEREKRMMSALGELIAAAVERIRLQQESNTARKRAEHLAEQAQQLAALEERTRLARELHDSVSQALYGIGLGAQTAQRFLHESPELARESVDYILALAEAGLAEMRALIFELRPESLENEGLAIALAKQAASIQARHGIHVHLDLCDEPTITLATKESLYRVVREALHNIVKHASASEIHLKMHYADQTLQIEVSDNGVGFDVSQEFPGHLGLHSMRERIAQMGGSLRIHSTLNQGTLLCVIIPTMDESQTKDGERNET